LAVEHSEHEGDAGPFAWKMADHFGSAACLAEGALDQVGVPARLPVFLRAPDVNSDKFEVLDQVNRPGFLGRSGSWKGCWRHANREETRKPVTWRYSRLRRSRLSESASCAQCSEPSRHDPALARQLGYGAESIRFWVRKADIDAGTKSGTTTEDAKRIEDLEQEYRELRRANGI
jgi:hypothetical protein